MQQPDYEVHPQGPYFRVDRVGPRGGKETVAVYENDAIAENVAGLLRLSVPYEIYQGKDPNRQDWSEIRDF